MASRKLSIVRAAGLALVASIAGCACEDTAPIPDVKPGALVLATSSLPEATVGEAYAFRIEATGGAAPYRFSLAEGHQAPPGLTLESDGQLAGVPTTSGDFPFTIAVTDASSLAGSFLLQLHVGPPLSPRILTESLPSATVGQIYQHQLLGEGGTPPPLWAVTGGSLPPGLELYTDGFLSGKPAAAGTYALTVTLRDAAEPPREDTKTYVLTVAAPSGGTLAVTTTALPDGVLGVPYRAALAASGGTAPYGWIRVSGSLPAGLALHENGTIQGTPAVAGTSVFTVLVSDSAQRGQTARAQLAVTILEHSGSLQVATVAVPGGVVGEAYEATLAAAGGSPPYAWQVLSGALPPGIALEPGGTLARTPEQAGTFTFLVQASDSAIPVERAERQLTVVVDTPVLRLVTATLPRATVGAAYDVPLEAAGGNPPYSWFVDAGALPEGLALDPITGRISGRPARVEQPSFTILVRDASAPQKTAQGAFSLEVVAASSDLTVATTGLPDAVEGALYTVTLSASGGASPYRWSLSSGSLPAGLRLDSAGVLSGTPSATGSFTFTVQVLDAADPTGSATRSLTVQVRAPLAVTTATLAAGVVGTSYSATIAAGGGSTPYLFTVSSGSLPAGLALATSGALSGTPTAAGSYGFTVKVTDGSSPAQIAHASFSIRILSPLSLDSTSLPGGTAGATYAATAVASGGEPPYQWSLSAGALPDGLALDPVTGRIEGTPSAAGTFHFTLAVRDSSAPRQDDSAPLSITIAPAPVALTVTTTTLPGAVEGSAYSAALAAQGGAAPYRWSITAGSLPAGLALDPDTGVISGTPTGAGTSSFTVSAVDASTPQQTASASLTLIVTRPLGISTTSLPDGAAGRPYSASLAGAGGTTPYAWSVTSGALPPGLSLDSASGSLSGTPSSAGSFSFTVQVVDASLPQQSTTATLTIRVAALLTITTESLPDGTAGTDYSVTLQAAGGTPPRTWSISAGALPAGLSLNTATGAITGVPEGASSSTFTIAVSDGSSPQQSTSKAFTLTIRSAGTPSITTASLPEGTVGASYSATLAAAGGLAPYRWAVSAGALPAGLSLDAATGAITGTPTSAGPSTFTIRVTDSANPAESSTRQFTVRIVAPLAVSTSSLPGGIVGQAYSTALSASGGTTPYRWSVQSGLLPTGLSLDSTTGILSGNPTTAGNYSFTIQVVDSSSPQRAATAQLSIAVTNPLAVTTTLLPNGIVGAAYSALLSATGGTTPYGWSVTAGALPPGLSLEASTGRISGSPTTSGTWSFTVTASDGSNPAQRASANLSIAVRGLLSVTTASLPGATVGVAYSAALAASGGTAPYEWSIQGGGTLPPGLSLDSATGVISGNPTAAGTYNFTVVALDSSSPQQRATKQLSIVVSAPGTLTITTSSLPDGVKGASYSATLAAAGGVTPYTWTVVAGALPTGLSLTSSTGAIGGTTTASGTFTFTVRAADSANPAQTALRDYSIRVADPLAVTSSTLPDGVVGKAYSATLTGSGGITPYTWSLVSGSLPAGLSLDTARGVISGTPTATASASFTVRLVDSSAPQQTAQKALTLRVAAPLSLDTTVLPDGIVGASYSATLAASGGTTPYRWVLTSGSLPPGLSLDAATGAITGTPSSAGGFGFTVQVSDAAAPAQSASATLSITVVASLTVTTGALADGMVGVPYAATLQAAGGTTPYRWAVTAGALPTGLSLNNATGALSGTPTAAGPFTFTVTVTDASLRTAQKQLTITIAPAPVALAITTASLPDGTVGAAYAATLTATGGTTPYTWSVAAGSLPAGLTLDTATGAITGTPTTAASYTFTVRVTDASAAPQSATKQFTVAIVAALSVSTASLPGAVVGKSYSTTLAAAGGTQPYAWSISAGSLPAGLSLDSATGVISGTPLTANTSSFTVRVVDSSNPRQSATRALSIVVTAPLRVTTSSLANGVVGSSYSAALAATGGTTPYRWSVSAGALPAGLSLDADAGTIGGTPTAAGTFPFTVSATDSSSPAQIARADLQITILDRLAVTTTSLPAATEGVPYSTTLSATGGKPPYTWSFVTGSLPAGLTLDPAMGTISGTPTASGTFALLVKVADSSVPALEDTQDLSLAVAPAGTFTIATTSLPDCVKGAAYSAALQSDGGTSPYEWAVTAGSLPEGLSLDDATGVIAGVCTLTGTFEFTVGVTDGLSRTASRALSIRVADPLLVTTSSLPNAVMGTAYSATLSASGGHLAYQWSITLGTLPSGLTLDPATGVIAGTPSASGTFTFTVRVADTSSPQQSATRQLSIRVSAPLTITTFTLPRGRLNQSYTATLSAVGGVTPYTWSISVGSLPPGLSLDPALGTITGTPTERGTFGFTVQAADSAAPPQTASKALSLAVQ